jgi:hypothetical protein
MLRFYMDEGVDGPITQGLRARGVDVLTVQEDGRAGLRPDLLVLDRATELQRVAVCQDRDFLREAHLRQGLTPTMVVGSVCSCRLWFEPERCYDHIGFRVVVVRSNLVR